MIKIARMGWFVSSEEVEMEVKAVDSTGHVNNNIVIQEARDIHSQLDFIKQLLNATYFLCFIEALKLTIYLYNGFKKTFKKKYGANQLSK